MNDRDTRDSPIKVLVVLAAVVILLPLTYSLVTYVFAGGSVDSEPFLEPPEARFKYCVKDAEWMRFHHWELLKEIRNDVVRDGNVGETTFDDCRACHPNREQFCNKCHDAVNARPDCFGCHYYPESPEPVTEMRGEHG